MTIEETEAKVVVPETHDLRRVALVLQAVATGQSPHDDCGLSAHQASYALQAAQALNLLAASGRAYQLTKDGRQLLELPWGGLEARGLLTRSIEAMPLVVDCVPNLLSPELTEHDLAELLQSDPRTGLSASTAKKRATALLSWREQVTSTASGRPEDRLLVVHFSDIHIQSERAKNPILERADAIARCLGSFDLQQVGACAIVVTGDIANTGHADEYALASEFLNEVRTAVSGRLRTEIHVVVVPGNHDCTLQPEGSVRKKLLSGPIQVDEEIFEQVVTVQSNFERFAEEVETGLTDEHDKLGTRIQLATVGARTVRFDKYNTAWCSRKSEQQGGLVFAVPDFSPSIPDADVVIALFHHPYNWLESSNGRAFREHVEATADVALTGHEHVPRRSRTTLEGGGETEYLEGMVLQDSEDDAASGFSTLLLDFVETTQQTTTFRWDNGKAFVTNESYPARSFLRNKRKASAGFAPTEQFRAHLSDPGEAYKHPKRDPLQLADIFVYPELRATWASKSQNTKTIIRQPFHHLLKEKRVFILGDDLAGKTALAKRLFEDLHREGIIPVLLDGREIDSGDVAALDRLRRDAAARAYGDDAVEAYVQLGPDKRALIIDDVGHSRLASDVLDEAIGVMARSFEYVVVIGNETFSFSLLDALEKEGSVILEYETARIEPFGHRNRYELIEKWCFLGRRADDDTTKLSTRAHQLDELVGQAVGNEMLPTYPALLLLCLQQIETSQHSEIADGSFGHLYDALITSNLWAGGQKVELGAKRTFLSLVAHKLFTSSTESMPTAEWELVYREYCDEYDVPLASTTFFSEVFASGLVAQADDDVTFRYKYAFCYFVACHLARNVPDAERISNAQQLCERLFHEQSANILLFMAHLDHTGSTHQTILKYGESLLDRTEDLDLHARLLPLGTSPNISQLTLEGSTAEERRRVDRERRDKSDRELANDASDNLPVEVRQHITALRTIHILGQVLRSSAGSMPATEKRRLLKECYDLGIRTSNHLIRKIVEEHAEITEELGRLLVRQRPELAYDLSEVKERVLSFLISLCEGVVYGTTLHVSNAVGTSSLSRTFDYVLKEHGKENNMYALFDFAIRLEHFEKFPEHPLQGLAKRFAQKHSPNNVLRRLVWRYLSFFRVPRDRRRSLCAQFDIRESHLLTERKLRGED